MSPLGRILVTFFRSLFPIIQGYKIFLLYFIRVRVGSKSIIDLRFKCVVDFLVLFLLSVIRLTRVLIDHNRI